MQVIGVIGVGRMGLPVSARLVRAGYVVVASDRDAERRGRIEAVGARWAETVRKVAEVAEVLITVLPGSGELRAVMSPLLPTLKPALAWIDLTSTSPLIGSQLRARAVHLESLDAPMGGGPEAAGEGMLELFVGLWFGQALAIGEALLLARRFGLDLDRVRAALTNSAADSRFIRHDLPELLGR